MDAGGEQGEMDESTFLVRDAARTGPAGVGKRHLTVAVCFFGMFFSYVLRGNMSVALVAMVRRTNITEASGNYTLTGTCPDPNVNTASALSQEGEFDWSPSTQGIILSAFFYGYITTQLLGGAMSQRFGGKLMFGLGMGLMSLLTLLAPVLARVDASLLIASRVLAGVAEGVTLPAMSVLISKWAPYSEKSRFGAIALSGNNLGTAFAYPVTGLLSEYGFDGGWPSSFYVLGGLGVLWVLALLFFTVENPENDKSISNEELKYILKTTGSREKRDKTPWIPILTSMPVWAMVAAHATKNWAYYTLLTTLPSYLEQVLKFNISANGFISALPFLCMTCMEVIGSFAADKIRSKKLLSDGNVRKLFTALGCFPACLLMIVVGFVGCDQVAAVVVLCVSTGMIGLASSGMMVNMYDLAPRHAGTVMGISNTFATIPGMVSPSIVEAITGGTPYFSRWRWVFILSCIIYTLGGIAFMVWSQATEQEWAKPQQLKVEVGREQSKQWHESSLPMPPNNTNLSK